MAACGGGSSRSWRNRWSSAASSGGPSLLGFWKHRLTNGWGNRLNVGSPRRNGDVDVQTTARLHTAKIQKAGGEQRHWYDDPPYDSDPEEFLCSSAASVYLREQTSLVSNAAQKNRRQGSDTNLSKRTATNHNRASPNSSANDSGVSECLPQNGTSYLHCHSTEHLNGHCSACVCSSGSTKSLECCCPNHLCPEQSSGLGKAKRCSLSASEDGLSQSSDYEDHDDLVDKPVGLSQMSREGGGRASVFMGRVRGLSSDVRKRISRFRSRTESEAAECKAGGQELGRTSASSVDSDPTATASNYGMSGSEEAVYTGPYIGRARALVDYTPSPYDKDALKFQAGDVINIVTMNQTGSWTGVLKGKLGHFKFINVKLLPPESESPSKPTRRTRRRRRCVSDSPASIGGGVRSVDQLLHHLCLEEYIGVFVLNGFENLDLFREVEEEDLDYLGIQDPTHRTKILNAVDLLQDFDSLDHCTDDVKVLRGKEDDEPEETSRCNTKTSSHRDSGCYTASSENISHTGEGKSPAEQVDPPLPNRKIVETWLSEQNKTTAMPPPTVGLPSQMALHRPSSVQQVNGISFPSFENRPLQSGCCGSTPTKKIFHPSNRVLFWSSGQRDKTAESMCHDTHRLSVGKQLRNVLAGRVRSASLDREAILLRGSGDTANRSANRSSQTQSAPPVLMSTEDDTWKQKQSSVWATVPRKPKLPHQLLSLRVKSQYRPSLELPDVWDGCCVANDLLTDIKRKLEDEEIDLTQEPYTDKTGFCGIPAALVLRYSDELKCEVARVAYTLDQYRIGQLQCCNRPAVPNDFLAESCDLCLPLGDPASISPSALTSRFPSPKDWLISVGLPMYGASLAAAGIRSLSQLSAVSPDECARIVSDPDHRRRLLGALTTLRLHVGSDSV